MTTSAVTHYHSVPATVADPRAGGKPPGSSAGFTGNPRRSGHHRPFIGKHRPKAPLTRRPGL